MSKLGVKVVIRVFRKEGFGGLGRVFSSILFLSEIFFLDVVLGWCLVLEGRSSGKEWIRGVYKVRCWEEWRGSGSCFFRFWN